MSVVEYKTRKGKRIYFIYKNRKCRKSSVPQLIQCFRGGQLDEKMVHHRVNRKNYVIFHLAIDQR